MPRRGGGTTPAGRRGGGSTLATDDLLDLLVPDAVADAIGERAMQAMDLSEEASIATSAALNARARSLGLPELSTSTARGRPPPPRATHECDACGKGGASRTCSGCRSVYYCGAPCQRRDWSSGGHKAACKEAAAAATAAGAAAVATLRDETLPVALRGHEDVYLPLDASGPYAAAVAAGLFPAMRALLVDEAATVGDRYASGNPLQAVSVAHHCLGLFRGGRRATGPEARGFGAADGSRAGAYFRHHPDAWGGWVAAAGALAVTALTRPVTSQLVLHAVTHRAARDVWSVTTLMLARPDCARAVLYGGPEPEEEAARTRLVRSRMTATVAQLTSFLVVAAAASDEEDPGSVLDGFMNQTAAQLVDWVSVLVGPAVDMRAMLRLRGHRRVLYERVAVPLGVALNRKGSTLTSAEARVAMQGRA